MSSSGASDAAEAGGTAEVAVVCGPTGAGKSAVAAWIADRAPVTIVSADSRAVYRGFDIGTAKPTPAERARTPHAGVDVVEPTERYSAAAWAELADAAISAAHAEGRIPVVVGGTGFYLRALFEPLFAEPELDPERRAALERELAPLATPALREWVARLDPARAHLGRAQLLRAIEVALLTGRRLTDLHRAAARPARRRPRYLAVDPGPVLREWIARRTDAMLAAGWLDEVRALDATVPEDAPAWNASGYRVLREVVRGMRPLDAARERVIIETRQYAKRQRTWFRHQLPAERVTYVDPAAADWERVVGRWWNEGRPVGGEFQ